jgi:hypothetical protein
MPFNELVYFISFVISFFPNEKKVNVFKVKDLKIYENDVQSQREDLTPRCTF